MTDSASHTPPFAGYGGEYVEYGTTGETITGSPSGAFSDTQVREAPFADPASVDDYRHYHNTGAARDYLTEQAGKFTTDVPEHVRPYSMPRGFTQTGMVIAATKRISGINIKEATGAGTATVTVYRGVDSQQQPIMYVTLAANESIRDFPPIPILAIGGIYIAVTGTVVGVIYTEEHQAAVNVH